MNDSQSLGKQGEDLAADHLREKGYTVRHRNWIAGKNELDIIAENKDFVVFVEVKTRSERPLVEPSVSISREKRQSMISAADIYIRRYNIMKPARFDLIFIEEEGEGFGIDHREDAFYPTLR
jgi:putative endonuclease